MPFTGNTYALPAGSLVTNGQTSDESQHNTPLQDIETALTTAKTEANEAAVAAILASTSNGEGASLVGIEDSGGLIAATTVEGALAENRAAIDAIEADYLTSADTGTVGSALLAAETDEDVFDAIGNKPSEIIKISTYILSEATYSDALKAAIAEVAADDRRVLDLEGLKIPLETPVTVTDTDITGGTWTTYNSRGVTIMNGTICAADGTTWASTDYLLTLEGTSATGMRNVVLINVQFAGSHTSASTINAQRGLKISGYYHFVLSKCWFYDLPLECVFEEDGNGFFVHLCRFQPQNASDTRTATCVTSDSPDCFYMGGWFDWCLKGVVSSRGSQHFVGVHWSIGGATSGELQIGGEFTDPTKIHFHNCDIDSAYFVIDNSNATYAPTDEFRSIVMSDCDWQSGEDFPTGIGGILNFHPQNASMALRGIIITSNEFQFSGTNSGKRIVSIDNTSGSFNVNDADHKYIHENNVVYGSNAAGLLMSPPNGVPSQFADGATRAHDESWYLFAGEVQATDRFTYPGSTAALDDDGGNGVMVRGGGADRWNFVSNGKLIPQTATDIGNTSSRINQLWATVATDVSSDARLKTDVGAPLPNEIRAAILLSQSIRRYKLKSDPSGDWHFGVIAQDVERIFSSVGLDASEYALFTRDQDAPDGMLSLIYDELQMLLLAAMVSASD